MKCPNCRIEMEKGDVELEDSGIKVKGLICPSCYEMKMDDKGVDSALVEYKEYLQSEKPLLRLRRRVSQMSGGKIGIYFPQDLVESLHINKGEEVEVFPINEKTIVIQRH